MRTALAMILVFGLVVSGCATMGGNAARGVDDAVEDMVEALLAKDVDAVMATYSENFKNYEYASKADFARFMAQNKSMGYLDGLKIDRSGETIKAEGDTAKVGPISVSGYFGVITISLDLAKESDGWMIVSQDIYGM